MAPSAAATRSAAVGQGRVTVGVLSVGRSTACTIAGSELRDGRATALRRLVRGSPTTVVTGVAMDEPRQQPAGGCRARPTRADQGQPRGARPYPPGHIGAMRNRLPLYWSCTNRARNATDDTGTDGRRPRVRWGAASAGHGWQNTQIYEGANQIQRIVMASGCSSGRFFAER